MISSRSCIDGLGAQRAVALVGGTHRTMIGGNGAVAIGLAVKIRIESALQGKKELVCDHCQAITRRPLIGNHHVSADRDQISVGEKPKSLCDVGGISIHVAQVDTRDLLSTFAVQRPLPDVVARRGNAHDPFLSTVKGANRRDRSNQTTHRTTACRSRYCPIQPGQAVEKPCTGSCNKQRMPSARTGRRDSAQQLWHPKISSTHRRRILPEPGLGASFPISAPTGGLIRKSPLCGPLRASQGHLRPRIPRLVPNSLLTP